MMKIQEVTDFLESIAPRKLAESYDNVGLLTGKFEQIIRGILFSLDATEDIVLEAINNSCNMIICHHPIIFSGLKKINGYHYVEKAIIAAIKNDIAIYAIHTNLDNVLKSGVNEKIAQKINLQNLSILRPLADSIHTGSGVIGHLQHEMSTDYFLKLIKSKFNCAVIRHTKILKPTVQHIAICGGSAAFLIKDAIMAKADVFITADVKYHEFFEANGQITILDIGHFESEQFTIELLFELISQKFTNFALRKSNQSTNPINYY